MTIKPNEIFSEYKAAMQFKSSLGKRGMYEQNRINERFYIGDQWYGANCGNDRPLVRHNIIKRIGDYKMSQVLSSPAAVEFSAEGMPSNKSVSISKQNALDGTLEGVELITKAFGKYFNTTCERVNFADLQDKVLRDSYISGTGVLYTYWDSGIDTGLYADDAKTVKIKGDIACQVLDIEDVYFGDSFIEDVQAQPFIIISSSVDLQSVLREARLYGADVKTLQLIEESQSDGKITVLHKLFKEYKTGGEYTIKCVKVCEKAVVRPVFDTRLRLYPLSLFKWERKNNSPYGESEITYLIPNQIAINRMITANVWSAMTTGMPIMLVNGDTVSEKITNEPGQIIKVYGSNEDVAGAVKYVTPPNSAKDYDGSINSLINNTLTQSGANEVALGDSRADNATALLTMRTAALMPLQIVKNRFHTFIEETARIWAEFWVTQYGNRKIKIYDETGIWYLPFDGEKYKNLLINTKVDILSDTVYTEKERLDTLITLFEKGIINRAELISRLPEGVISDKKSLILREEESQNDGQ
jgi:hypothetical protein